MPIVMNLSPSERLEPVNSRIPHEIDKFSILGHFPPFWAFHPRLGDLKLILYHMFFCKFGFTHQDLSFGVSYKYIRQIQITSYFRWRPFWKLVQTTPKWAGKSCIHQKYWRVYPKLYLCQFLWSCHQVNDWADIWPVPA